jgi:hypothetical protein
LLWSSSDEEEELSEGISIPISYTSFLQTFYNNVGKKDVSLYLQYRVYNYEQILNYMYSMKIDNEYIFIRWTTITKNDIITIITNFYFYIIYNTFILE